MPLQQSVSRNHPVLTIVLVMAATGEHTHKNRYTNYLNNIDALIQKDSTLMFHSLQNTPPQTDVGKTRRTKTIQYCLKSFPICPNTYPVE